MSEQKTWRVGVAGLGTVGGGLIKFLTERPDYAPAGGRVQVTGVSARSRSRKRDFDISAMTWFDDPVALAASADIDVFVELVGGSDGPAKAAVEAALKAGKPVVTANKALIAEHGRELAELAEAAGVPLLFEAAVMGGTPAVKMVREALVGEHVGERAAGRLHLGQDVVAGAVEDARDGVEVLAEAQRLGYAEADPTMDIGGFDAAHKITILAALAFGCAPNYAGAEIEGIEQVELADIRLAHDLGFRIKLIASAEQIDGGVSVRVHPALAPLGHPLAQANGALNALFIEGRRVGRIFVQGPGAGAGPTAAAAAADIADVMTGAARPVFQARASLLEVAPPVEGQQRQIRAYVRLMVKDEPGVIAAISETLAEENVSIDSFLQKPVHEVSGTPIVLTTHATPEPVLLRAIERIGALPHMLAPPRMIRIARV